MGYGCGSWREDGERGYFVAANGGASYKKTVEKETSWKRFLQRKLRFQTAHRQGGGYREFLSGLGFGVTGRDFTGRKHGNQVAASTEEPVSQHWLELCGFLEAQAKSKDVSLLFCS